MISKKEHDWIAQNILGMERRLTKQEAKNKFCCQCKFNWENA